MSTALYLAHPMTQPGGLPFPPAVVATMAVLLVLFAARLGAPRRAPAEAGGAPAEPLERPAAAPAALWWATRLLGVALFVVVVASGRLRNAPLGPTLVLTAAWPTLLLGSAVLGQVWRWLNPFDTLGRLVERPVPAEQVQPADRAAPQPVAVGVGGGPAAPVPGEPHEGAVRPLAVAAGAVDVRPREAPPAVWWAVLPALGWGYYAHVYLDSLHPRSVAAALSVYMLVMLAGTLVLGRRRWLLRTEVFGLALSWAGLLRRGGLRVWRPPAGAEAVLGVLIGGLLMASLRSSTLWTTLPYTPFYPWYPTVGLLVCAGLAAYAARGCSSWAARLGADGTVAAALVPMLVGVALATSLAGHRLLVALQSLPRMLTDPFNLGWDPIGAATWTVHPQPFGVQGVVWLQVAVLVLGAMVGARIASARAPHPRAAEPATVAVAIVLVVAVSGMTAV